MLRHLAGLGLLLVLSAVSMVNCDAAVTTDTPIKISQMFVVLDKDSLHWTTCLSFTNEADKPIRAVQFRFTFYDAFDSPITSLRGDRVGEFSPNVLIEGPSLEHYGGESMKEENCWHTPVVAGSLSYITAEAVKVRYGDGTVVTLPEPYVTFKAQFLSNIDDSHPAFIMCGILKIKYDIVAAHQDSPCWKKYEAWKAAQTPTPAPSSTPSG